MATPDKKMNHNSFGNAVASASMDRRIRKAQNSKARQSNRKAAPGSSQKPKYGARG